MAVKRKLRSSEKEAFGEYENGYAVNNQYQPKQPFLTPTPPPSFHFHLELDSNFVINLAIYIYIYMGSSYVDVFVLIDLFRNGNF